MSTTNTTPGPWIVETFTRPGRGEVTQVSAFSEDGNRILCCGVQSFNKIEDARLIAAAPDLLRALQNIINSTDEGNAAILDSLVIDARAAIVKAKLEK